MAFIAPPKFWQERSALLGTKPDRDLAAQWGVPISQVKKQRERQGIAACKPSYASPPTEWKPEQDAMLGTMPDTETAIALGNINPQAVKARRKSLGIPSFAEQVSAAKRASDERTFENMEWPAELLADLGKRFDHYLAARFKIPEWMVCRKRTELGIKEEPLSHLHKNTPSLSPISPCDHESVAATLPVASLIGCGRTIWDTARELGIAEIEVSARLQQFMTIIRAPYRLGADLPETWHEAAAQIPGLLNAAAIRLSLELECGTLKPWVEPLKIQRVHLPGASPKPV